MGFFSGFSQSQIIDEMQPDRASLVWISKEFDGIEPGSARITQSCIPGLFAHASDGLCVPVCTRGCCAPISGLHRRTSLSANSAF